MKPEENNLFDQKSSPPLIQAVSGGIPEDELRKLAELHKDGIISQEEFDEKKKRILGLEPNNGVVSPPGLSPIVKAVLGVIGFLILFAVLGAIFTDDVDTHTGDAAVNISKTEWKHRHPNLVGARGSRDALERDLGKPQTTQTLGDDEYWYFECSDGEIQVNIGNPSHGDSMLTVFEVNDF